MVSHHLPPAIEELEAPLSSLRPIERRVVSLSAREQLTNDEIAARLGITAEAAERLLAAALGRLDSALQRGGRPWWHLW